MKTWTGNVALWLLASIFLAVNAAASVFYVDVNSTNPTPPYADWSTASTDIQSAVDASSDGDQIWVNDGIYQTGGRVVYGLLTNRVVINKAVTVESVNGPTAATILGFPVNGDSAVRCVYLTNNATLIGFTLALGDTRSAGDTNLEDSGGGAWCESTNALLLNCFFITNAASQFGGGIYSGTSSNCTFLNNSATYGGAAEGGILLSSLVYSNKSSNGGGIYSCVSSNCTFMFNLGCAAFNSTLYNCLISTNQLNPFSFGSGFGCGAYNCTLNDCVINGNRASSNGGGAYNCTLNGCTINSNFANSSGGGAYNCTLNNCAIINNGAMSGGGTVNCILTNCTLIGNSGGGAIGGTLNNCFLAQNTSINGGGVFGQNNFSVTANNCTFSNNFATKFGGGAYSPSLGFCVLSNCTLIANMATNDGGGAYFCTLNNCIVTSNSTPEGSFGSTGGGAGGGAYASSLFNCMVVGNTAGSGGGVEGGTLTNCVLAGNSVSFGGGGADGSIIGLSGNNCVFSNNFAYSGGGAGGGTSSCALTNCLLYGNTAYKSGGGGSGVTLVNCTVVGNMVTHADPEFGGGGVAGAHLLNCVVYFNLAPYGSNYSTFFSLNPISATNCCTTPLISGSAPTSAGFANFTNTPNFVNLAGGDYHLQFNSPCINAGNGRYITNRIDLDGNPRVVGVAVDMGAYEYQGSTSILPYVWLLQYNLATDGSADFADADGDGVNNFGEWRAGTDPTNPLSVLKIVSLTNNASGLTIAWQSVSNVTYYVQRSTNFATQPFVSINSNIVGQNGITTNKDTNAKGFGPYFYRVGVQ